MYCSTALSVWFDLTYRSPSVLAVFQSAGWSSTTRRYSAMAASILPVRRSFSALRSAAARSMGTSVKVPGGYSRCSTNGIKQRRRAERAPMRFRIAKSCNGVEMIRGRVALVAIEPVPRVEAMKHEHLTIARHLGDDRRRGDRRTPPIAVQHAALRHRQIR